MRTEVINLWVLHILIVGDLMNYAKENDIRTGAGRGSQQDQSLHTVLELLVLGKSMDYYLSVS